MLNRELAHKMGIEIDFWRGDHRLYGTLDAVRTYWTESGATFTAPTTDRIFGVKHTSFGVLVSGVKVATVAHEGNSDMAISLLRS